MRYFPQRARRKLDISLLLKVCPDCLGDLVFPRTSAASITAACGATRAPSRAASSAASLILRGSPMTSGPR